jgi:hypothetical protein
MSVAKGQDLLAEDLLLNPPASVSIFIPNICYIEAISTYKLEEKNALYFEEYITKKIRELRRDITSNHAQFLLQNLEQSLIENTALINDIKSRLYDAIENLNNNAQIISLDRSSIHELCQKTLAEPENLLVRNDIIDNLILQCIIGHANSPNNSRQEKAFISENSKDFNTSGVKETLRNAGIRYFTSTQHFLDWFNSRT